jgi:2-methylcitrate dehydratase PrpD
MMTKLIAAKEEAAVLFAKNVVNIRYKDIPKEVVENTKNSVLDTLAILIAASGVTPGLKELVGLIREWGGKKESTIICFGGKVPAPMAAFANGSMGHCLDYDDFHYDAQIHSGSPILCAGFAIAERLGKVQGKDFITALALGHDFACRLALAANQWRQDWHKTTVFGAFSATATCGKLLKLNVQEMVDAFGIVLTEAAGTMEVRYNVGHNMGGMRDAYPSRAGVFSSLMAERGLTGPRTSLEGRAGLFNTYFRGEYDREALLKDLGKNFEGINVGYKPWPSCSTTHTYIGATLSLISDHNIKPEDIKQMTAIGGDYAESLCVPIEERRKPITTLDAKFSIPFCIAVAAAKGRVALGDFTPKAIKDKRVLELSSKVMFKYDKAFDFVQQGDPPGIVEIQTKDSKTYSKRVDIALGNPRNPISREFLIEKFRDCTKYAVKSLTKTRIEKVIDQVVNLEQVDDVGGIIRLLG